MFKSQLLFCYKLFHVAKAKIIRHHYQDTMLSYHHIGSKSWYYNQEEGERRGRGNLRHSGKKGGQETNWRRGVTIDFYQTFTIFRSYFIMLEKRERRRIFMQVWEWGEKTMRTLKTDTRSHSDQILHLGCWLLVGHTFCHLYTSPRRVSWLSVWYINVL